MKYFVEIMEWMIYMKQSRLGQFMDVMHLKYF